MHAMVAAAYTWMRMADFDSIRGTIDGRVAVSVFLEDATVAYPRSINNASVLGHTFSFERRK
eukprot:4675156-Amphidinium_carterae.1